VEGKSKGLNSMHTSEKSDSKQRGVVRVASSTAGTAMVKCQAIELGTSSATQFVRRFSVFQIFQTFIQQALQFWSHCHSHVLAPELLFAQCF
jgi:beta-lactam-binding protein with PASTA domain